MADRPILFSAPMVRALIEGRKTQTRRLLPNPEYYGCPTGDCPHARQEECNQAMRESTAADLRFAFGDRLWVKEALEQANGEAVGYPADGSWLPNTSWVWKRDKLSPIFMPRGLSRLTLTVTDVRVERLQDCSEADALAEGVCRQYPTAEDHDWLWAHHEENYGSPPSQADIDQFDEGVFVVPGTDCGFGPKPRQPIWGPTATNCYASLWNSINGAGAWEENPWVVAITFAVEQRNIDA